MTSLGPTGYTFAPCVLGNCGRFRHGFGNFGFQGFVASYPVVIPIFATPEVPIVPVPVDESGNVAYDGPQENEIVGTQGGTSSIMYSGQRHVTMAHPVGTRAASDEAVSERRARSSNDEEEQDQPRQRVTSAPEPAPLGPQETTVLVFKDGHKLNVTNYAIQGETLFNFSQQGPRRIALSDLDVKATVKANEDNGVQFRLP